MWHLFSFNSNLHSHICTSTHFICLFQVTGEPREEGDAACRQRVPPGRDEAIWPFECVQIWRKGKSCTLQRSFKEMDIYLSFSSLFPLCQQGVPHSLVLVSSAVARHTVSMAVVFLLMRVVLKPCGSPFPCAYFWDLFCFCYFPCFFFIPCWILTWVSRSAHLWDALGDMVGKAHFFWHPACLVVVFSMTLNLRS